MFLKERGYCYQEKRNGKTGLQPPAVATTAHCGDHMEGPVSGLQERPAVSTSPAVTIQHQWAAIRPDTMEHRPAASGGP